MGRLDLASELLVGADDRQVGEVKSRVVGGAIADREALAQVQIQRFQ